MELGNIFAKKPADETQVQKKEEQDTKQRAEKLVKQIKRSEKSVKNYQFFLLRLLVLLLVIWILFFQIIGITRMPSTDMYPRIDSGDMLLFYRLDKDVRSQDVIVINKNTPDSPKTKTVFVCRVIAAEGDTLDIDAEHGRVSVNGNVLMESKYITNTYQYEGYVNYPVTLEKGQCFVLADDRTNGADSRYFGPVEKKEIVGTVITVLRRNNL